MILVIASSWWLMQMPIASVLSAVDGMKNSRAGDAALMRFQGDVIDTVWGAAASLQMEEENCKSAGNSDKADVCSALMAGTCSDVDPCASRINQDPNCCQWSCSKKMCLGSSGLYQVHTVSFMSAWNKGFPACYCHNMIVHLSSQWRRCSDSGRPSAKEKRAHSWRPSSLCKINQSLMLRQLLICCCVHK